MVRGLQSVCRQRISFSHLVKRWQFPSDQFITYETSDEPWCRKLGFGCEVEATESVDLPNAMIRSCNYDTSGALTVELVAYPSGRLLDTICFQ